MRFIGLFLTVLLAGCRHAPAEPEDRQAARLRASIEKYRADYAASIPDENRLIAETIAWLKGDAVTASRSRAVADARRLTEKWAKVYFVPRYMHGQLQFDEYSSERVRKIQARMLDVLKRRYFELHDYQRYAQYASESEMHHTMPGRLPRELAEFLGRLEARAPAVDAIGPLADGLSGG